MLDLTFPKMVITNTIKFSCFYSDTREWLCDVYNISPADWSSWR